MEMDKKTSELYQKNNYGFFVTNGDKFLVTKCMSGCGVKAHSFEDMTNLSKETRTMLQTNFVINHIKVDTMQRSEDGTVKNAVRLHDGLVVGFDSHSTQELPLVYLAKWVVV
jgi:23S rRNA (adenine2503-C2)-methyltransferase